MRRLKSGERVTNPVFTAAGLPVGHEFVRIECSCGFVGLADGESSAITKVYVHGMKELGIRADTYAESDEKLREVFDA